MVRVLNGNRSGGKMQIEVLEGESVGSGTMMTDWPSFDLQAFTLSLILGTGNTLRARMLIAPGREETR